jgi:hypothetical protein
MGPVGIGLALLCTAAGVVEAPGRVVDRVVVVVEGQVLTQSELEFEARVNLINHGAVGAAVGELDEEALRSALELAINQRLQEREADKLKAFPAERTELETALQSFRDRFGSPGDYQSFLNHHEADERQVVSILERGQRAEKMLDSKLKLRAQISEGDVRAYYDAHATQLGAPYPDLRQTLREKLFRDRYAQMAASELAQLRQKADVRSVAPFARKRLEGAGKGGNR